MNKKFLRRRGSNSSAFLIGMGLSGLYYLIVHMPFMHDSILHAYTTHHATEYAIVLLFFWACAEHLVCFLNGSKERVAVARVKLPERHGLEETDRAQELLEFLHLHHAKDADSMMYQRIQTALKFVHESQSVDGFRDYLESLKARDSDSVFDRYGFSRIVTTILPILGLIGTVVHFGAALTGLSMEGLTEKLPKMLSSMGTAFNTTFTAMTCMVVTFLVRFLVERRDNELLRRIDVFVEDELLHRFQSVDAATRHVTQLLNASNASLLTALVDTESKLISEWNYRLNAIQQRWDELNQRQELNFVHFLSAFERQQKAQISEVKQWSNELAIAQKLTAEVASNLAADGQHLQQSQRMETAVQELTSAIHLLTDRQQTTPLRLAS